MRRICVVVAAAFLAATGLRAQIFCWNLENFFDTRDDPATADEPFTPGGEYRWTRRKFIAKRNLIAKTIIASGERFGGEMPALVGLCEVENSFVLKSLLDETSLAKFRYRSVHRESPDPRGIDVALLYDPARVRLLSSGFITIKEFATREILYAKVSIGYPVPESDIHRLHDNLTEASQSEVGVTCEAKSSCGLQTPASQAVMRPIAATCEKCFAGSLPTQPADTLHIYMNHWPSKYGGAKASEHKRQAVCDALLAHLDSLQQAEPAAAIVLMGDFNDTPDADAIMELCRRANLMNISPKEGGTIKFKGVWEMIDQMLASPSAASITGPAEVFRPGFLLEEDKTFLGRKPRRTHIGPRYNAGASDHLPIIADILR